MVDTLYNYDGFDDDIKEVFRPVINRHKFKFFTKALGSYELRNDKCIIRFTYNRGEISCLIKDPKNKDDEFGNHVFLIFSFLHPDEADNDNDEEYNTKEQIVFYAEICNELENVLNGDFSWKNDYQMYRDKVNAMFRYVREELDVDHPISLQLAAGDSSWLKNMEQYVFTNHVDLTDYMPK